MIIAIGKIVIHVAIGLVEFTFLERAMITDVAVLWATKVVSSHTESGDS